MTDQRYQLLPPLSAEEYAALKADIAENGVLVPVVKDQHGNLLDGHHRVRIAGELNVSYRVDVVRVEDEDQARSLARRYNLARRHLTTAQKRMLIAEEINADPERSDRAIARLIGVDHKTVASVRRELSGEIPQPPALTREEAERLTDDLLQSLSDFDALVLTGLLGGMPKSAILSAVMRSGTPKVGAEAWHDHVVAPRIDDILAWPHGGWYAEECSRSDDELHTRYRAIVGGAA